MHTTGIFSIDSLVAVYVRVSSTSQTEASQRHVIQQWLAANGIEGALWFVDKATTGDNLDRPAFERLQGAIFAGRVRMVICYKLDRLSRSMRDGINVLCDWLDRGVRLVAVTQQIDFHGTVGKMLASVLFGLAEMEQETRRERQAAGIAVAKERGVYKGRKSGTTKGKPQRAVELRGRGLNDGEIAEAMGVSRRTVQRYLRQAT